MKSNSVLPTAIILAAGCASRFDGLKQLAPIDGKPSLQCIVDMVHGVSKPLNGLVVLGCEAEQIRKEIDFYDFTVVTNEDWAAGLSTSVKLGVQSAPEDTCGYTLLLADMPLIDAKTVELVLDRAATEGGIVATSYQGTRGFPVYLDGKYRDELLEKPSGDVGARQVVNDHRDELTLIETEDENVIYDIDTREDLKNLR